MIVLAFLSNLFAENSKLFAEAGLPGLSLLESMRSLAPTHVCRFVALSDSHPSCSLTFLGIVTFETFDQSDEGI